MKEAMISSVGKATNIKPSIVAQVIELLEAGNTVPFIARYRKELTGGLDEVKIKEIEETYEYTVQLHKRKEEVIRLIEEQGKLTDSLKRDIMNAEKLQRVEDLYRPYKQKRRTRATVAREKGLEPLAQQVWQQQNTDLRLEAENYLSEEHDLHTIEDVLAGVNDILAEWISDEPSFREHIRNETFQKGTIRSEVKNEGADEKGIFHMYYDYSEAVKTITSHRILALNRGEKEEVLKVSILPPDESIIAYLNKKILKHPNQQEKEVLEASIEDSYKRLIQPSVEREIRNLLTEKAEEQAIHVFSKNLRNLLLQPPLKGKTVLGIDPAYRTGCKLAAVDETGKVLAIDVMYPTPPKNDTAGAEKMLLNMLEQYPVELIAIGNGTASRETEQFVAETIQKHKLNTKYLIVNEAGASVYSASKLAREEFPDLQVEERSAISIARRVQDPLSELVKIDPQVHRCRSVST